MIARLRSAIAVAIVLAQGCAANRQENPSANPALPAPATRPASGRQRLLEAIAVTRELRARAVTTSPDQLKDCSPGPILPAEGGPGLPQGRHPRPPEPFPLNRDMGPYLTSRPWITPYLVLAKTPSYGSLFLPVPGEAWPTPADADELRKLLKDSDPAIRGLAVEALAALLLPEDIPAIAELLTDKNESLPGLGPNQNWRAAARPPRNFGAAAKPDDLIDLFTWHDRTVAAYAVNALYIITGQPFTAASFAAWWPTHKDARNSVWYWSNRITWSQVTGGLPYGKAPAYEKPPAGKPRPAWNANAFWKAVRDPVLADLADRPKETQAKIMLMCMQTNELRIDLSPLPKLLSRERALELLEGKNLWPDVDWKLPDRYYDFRPNAVACRNLEVGILSQATGLFTAQDVPALLAIGERNRAKNASPRSLVAVASRLLPPAPPGRLDDPKTRDGLLRTAFSSATHGDGYDQQVLGGVALELVNVGLPGNWDFLKAQYFANPRCREGIFDGLRWTPLTAAKRTALVDLLTDSRSDNVLREECTYIGGTISSTGRRQSYWADAAIAAINAQAGRELIPPSLGTQVALALPAAAALTEFHEKLNEFKALPPPPAKSASPATQPGATGKP